MAQRIANHHLLIDYSCVVWFGMDGRVYRCFSASAIAWWFGIFAGIDSLICRSSLIKNIYGA